MTQKNSLGSWRQAAAVVDGQRVAVGSGVILSVDSAGYTVFLNGKVIQRGTSVTRLQADRHESDVTITEGAGAGTTLRQIFRLDGDVLTACASRAGDERPTEFRSEPGSGHTLSVWLRLSEAEAANAVAGALPNWSWIVGILALTMLDGFNRGAEWGMAYWSGVLLSSALAFLILLVGCLAFKMPWRTTVVLCLALTVGVVVFRELRAELDPTLGRFGSLLVATASGLVAGLSTRYAAGRLLRVPAE